MPVFPHASFADLLEAVLGELPSHPETPLRLFPVIVPSLPFGDWLRLRIAERRGICMGIDFLMPQDFLRSVPGPATPRRDSAWVKRRLVWRLFSIAGDAAKNLRVTDPSLRDRFAIAELLADQLDQYGHFRPDMIRRWAGGKSALSKDVDVKFREQETWQRELWLQVSAAIAEPHPALELVRVQRDAAALQALRTAFPRLVVIGTGALDPLLIEVLAVMQAAGCQLSMHVLLPSLGYLGELRNTALPVATQDPELIDVKCGHPLLQSMGRHAVGSFLLLGELDDQYTHWPELEDEPPSSDSLLRRIQSDIRSLRTPQSSVAVAQDRSISVHSCFGPRREMEALREEILRAFSEIEGLKAEEIHIIAPSLETYAPLVSAVLEQGGMPLPVRVSEVSVAEGEPAVEAMLAMLKMADASRFSASELLEFVSLRATQDALGIADDEAGLDQIRSWIRDSGITSGLDPAGPNPDDGIGTWKFGRDRLIAGRWFGRSGSVKYASGDFVLPVSKELSGDFELQERWIHWFAQLEEVLRLWSLPATPWQWAERLGRACDEILSGDEDARLPLQDSISFLGSLENEDVVDAASILDWLTGEVGNASRRTMVSGKITMGRFKHLQNLPCRVLAIVGMQEGEFPSKIRSSSWDLLRLDPRVWDRNPRVDDRQLFLDAILTPSDRLIITAANRNIRTGKEAPYSPCVDELLRVACDMGGNRESLVTRHRLQPFAAEYFDVSSPLPKSFDKGQEAVASELLSGRKLPGVPFRKVTISSDAEINEIALSDLMEFWTDPAKAFLRAQRITISREVQDDQLFDKSPLALSKLETWNVKNEILRASISDEADLDRLKSLLKANRELPPGKLGFMAWDANRKISEPIAHTVRDLIGDDVVMDVFSSKLGMRVNGSLLLSRDETHWITFRPGNMDSPKYMLRAWIQVVVAAVSGRSLPIWIIDEKNPNTPRELSSMDSRAAAAILDDLIDGFIAGQDRPLEYAPNTSDVCAKIFLKQQDENAALVAAEQKWFVQGFNGAPDGEGLQPAASLAWRDCNPFENKNRDEWIRWMEKIAIPLNGWRNR